MLKRIVPFALVAALLAPAAVHAGRVIGGGDDDDTVDAGPAPTAPAKKDDKSAPAKDDKSKDAKSKDAKKDDAKAKDAKANDAKASDAKDAKASDAKSKDAATAKDAKEAAKDAKSSSTPASTGAPEKSGKDKSKVVPKGDVLDDTPAEKAQKAKDQEAKSKAEEAADAAQKKKDEEQRKLQEEKKAADAKKKLENKDQRLAAARKIRQLTRTSGSFVMGFALEPGEVKPNNVLSVRAQIAEKVDVPDPRYGDRVPQKNAELTAVVSGNGKKLRYEMHALDAPGKYGFHTTPLKDGAYLVAVEGKNKDGKPINTSFTIHVGVWPPPDFDTEEQNNLATDSGKAGRIIGEN
jgi:hypothetical protein